MGWVWWCPGGREGHLASEDNLSYTEGLKDPTSKKNKRNMAVRCGLVARDLPRTQKAPNPNPNTAKNHNFKFYVN